MTTVVGLITARGGSKSVPRKNVKLLAGKPLIAWTIEAALESRVLSQVIVSTDDEEIAQVSREWGAEVPFIRPPELAQDDSAHMDVVLHALRWLGTQRDSQPEYLMLLQPTSPLRGPEDIRAAVQLAIDKDADSIIGVCSARAHPFQVRYITGGGTLAEFIPDSPPPGTSQTRRQEFPAAYRVIGAIYLTRREVLLEQRTFQPPRTFPYIMPSHRSLEIDEPWDLHVANLILENRDDSQFH